jgi:hypothetical protein
MLGQSMIPMLQERPELEPLALQLLQWGLAGFKGSSEIEGLVDNAIDDAEKQPEQGNQPDPEQIKAQDNQAQRDHEMRMEVTRFQNEAKLTQIKMMSDSQEVTHEVNERVREINAQTEQDIVKEEAQKNANMAEESHETDEFLIRQEAQALIDRQTDRITRND